MRVPFIFASMLLVSCTCAPTPAARATQTPAPTETSASPTTPPPSAGERRDFGARIDTSLPLTPLGAIIASPGDHATHVVRTRGTVHRVCQRMGCWMELREGEGPAVRVPMAGHAFFLPKDCQGEPAEVEGTVVLAELSPEMRAHLGSEGATALASTVSIDARGVTLLGR